MTSLRSRFRLRSQAATVLARAALRGCTLLTMKTSWRRSPTASATTSSAPPSPYISAVSIRVRPRSMAVLRASTSWLRRCAFSPIRQVPMPRQGTCSPSGKVTYRMEIFRLTLMLGSLTSRPTAGQV